MAASDEDSKRKYKKTKTYFKLCAAGKRIHSVRKLDVGVKGILLTCNHGEKLCIREAYNILMEYGDKLYGREVDEDDDADPEEDIAEALKREVSEMNKKRSKKEFRFQAMDSRAKNVVFIRTKINDDPANLVHHILTKIQEQGQSKTQHIQRMLPVSATCRASLNKIETTAKEVLHPYFHSSDATASTFAILFKSTNNNEIRKGEVIKVVANAVTSETSLNHTVDLENPMYSIIVKVICNVCCLSVLKDYHKLKKYNIHAIAGNEPFEVSRRRIKAEFREKQKRKADGENEDVSEEKRIKQDDGEEDRSMDDILKNESPKETGQIVEVDNTDGEKTKECVSEPKDTESKTESESDDKNDGIRIF